jgi:hypothetical protein
MRRLRTLATTAVLALALANPLFAQRGQSGGNRGGGSRSDGGARQAQPRDSATVVDRMLDTGRRAGTGTPALPGLGSASLITPRPGVDAFRADPGTYGGRVIRPRGPSWGGVPVSSVPSWGGVPVYGSNHDKDKWDSDGDQRGGGRRRGSWRGPRGVYSGGYGVVYGLPYGYMPYGVAQPVVPGQQTVTAGAEIPEGFLRLLVTPREADVIVDGVVVGTVDDFGGRREQALPAGPHRIRIEAPGYDPVEFDVRVPAGDTISLRRELSRLPAPPRSTEPATPGSAPNPAPAGRKTFYAIPNCYLGDSIPRADSLPPGCSLKDMRVLPPH